MEKTNEMIDRDTQVDRDKINTEWFLNVSVLTKPKSIISLADLWKKIFLSNDENWKYRGRDCPNLIHTLEKIMDLSNDWKMGQELSRFINSTDNLILLGIVRFLHLNTCLKNLDRTASQVEQNVTGCGTIECSLDLKWIMQSFLYYQTHYGTEGFEDWVNGISLRLVSTVHPNETERNTILQHYNSILELYIHWKKDFESISNIPEFSPEFRTRRENLNQLRRTIKAEIETVWLSNYCRKYPISVQSEAKRLLERYHTIFAALPSFMKLLKYLMKESFYCYIASKKMNESKDFQDTFLSIWSSSQDTRRNRLQAIKETFKRLKIDVKIPKIRSPILTFSSWRGGDRDGNPYVVAAFTNEQFILQKVFVLEEYMKIIERSIDKLTISNKFATPSEFLINSLAKDKRKFPYLTQVKLWEPYRAKMCYIREKLKNTLRLARDAEKMSGNTVRPLLGMTIPGSSGYNDSKQFYDDILLVYNSLTSHSSNAEARSFVEDILILISCFGLHLTSIDFRQHSVQNMAALVDYLKAIDYPQASTISSVTEQKKQKFLLNLIGSTGPNLEEFNPWILSDLPKLTRDTWESFIIFKDAADTDKNAVGKFIISMCSNVSDILVILSIMKIVGMLESEKGVISKCTFDITGLFETVEDLKRAPNIISDLLSIKMIRDYIINLRNGRLTIMLGYSDSVRDGSSFTSDSQIAATSLTFHDLESHLNSENIQIKFVFYRGRGDTIPRGFGGSIRKAIASQIYTSHQEDHTEQNRYLRCYSSITSTIDHLHTIFAAHLSGGLSIPPKDTIKYQHFFCFLGRISNLKWIHLVRPEYSGKSYFNLLSKYSILPHLHRSYFASRPVTRGGVAYDIDSIRAIPFTMVLAQMREFTNAYYGTGTAFEVGCKLLVNENFSTTFHLLKCYGNKVRTEGFTVDYLLRDTRVPYLRILVEDLMKSKNCSLIQEVYESALLVDMKEESDISIESILDLYEPLVPGIDAISQLVLEVQGDTDKYLSLLHELYESYSSFKYSLENKETALLIRDKNIVEIYTYDCTAEEKKLLDLTEKEAQLTAQWLLKIMKQDKLTSKSMKCNFRSQELKILHSIQSKYLHEARIEASHENESNKEIHANDCIQMTILAIAEALGFAG